MKRSDFTFGAKYPNTLLSGIASVIETPPSWIPMRSSRKEYMSGIGARVSSEAASLICANGAGIPCIGFGTFGMRGAKLKSLLIHAIRAAFVTSIRRINGNEDAVGEAVQTSGIPRDYVFITTKCGLKTIRRLALTDR
jgi:hypothetical protein